MLSFGAVAATVALAIGLASAIPGFLPNRDNPTPTLIALDAPAALDGSTVPPVDAGATEEVPGAHVDQAVGDVPPLSPDDCTGAPRTREEVVEILSVAPAQGNSITATDLPADVETVADLSETLHTWQACTVFGQTWRAMAVETEQFIREDIYGDPLIPVAYSARTLNEILDVREVVDRDRAERMSDPAVAGDQFVARIDPVGGIETSAAGSPTLSARADLLLISPSTGETLRAGPAIFEHEDGEWRIRSIEMEPIGPVATAGRVVALSAPGISWSTTDFSIPIGGTIALTNDGSGGQHNFVIEGYNDGAPVDMPVGETVVWQVPADLAPGTYTFYCAIPGHRALMEGTVSITSS